MKTILIAGILSTLPLCHAFAEDSKAAIELAANAPQTLRSTKKFIIGRVFEEGLITESENAFRALLKRKDALKQLRLLIKDRSPSCQLYALLGLRLLGADEFDAEYARMKHSEIAVSTMSGCIAFQATLGDIAEDIKQGKIK